MSGEAIGYFKSVKFGDRYPSRKMLMIILADMADESFSCYPSLGHLCAIVESDRRAVQRLITKCADDKFLTVLERQRKNGSTSSNRYVLHGPWDNWAGTGVQPEYVDHTARQADIDKTRVRRGPLGGGGHETIPHMEGGHETTGSRNRPRGGHQTRKGAVTRPRLESPEEAPEENTPLNPPARRGDVPAARKVRRGKASTTDQRVRQGLTLAQKYLVLEQAGCTEEEQWQWGGRVPDDPTEQDAFIEMIRRAR